MKKQKCLKKLGDNNSKRWLNPIKGAFGGVNLKGLKNK